MNKIIAVTILLLSITGCTTSKSNNPNSYIETLSAPKPSNQMDLSTYLLKDKNNEWVINFNIDSKKTGNIKYSSINSKNSAWIPINAKQEGFCVSGFLGLKPNNTDPDCTTNLNSISSDLNKRSFGFENIIPSIIILPIGTVLSPLFLVLGDIDNFGNSFLAIAKTNEFSYKKYSDAFKQAKINEFKSEKDFDERYQLTSMLHLKLSKETLKYNSETRLNPTFENLIKNQESILKNKYTDEVFNQLQINISDKSGLWKGPDNLTADKTKYLKSEVTIEHNIDYNNLKNDSFVFELSSISSELLTLEQLHSKLISYEKNLISAQKRIVPIQNQLENSDATVSLTAKNERINSQDGLNISWSLPSIKIKNGNLARKPLATVNINSMDFKKVLPRSFNLKDNQIELNILDDKLTITNNSNGFLDVKRLSIYVDTKIHTKSLEGNNTVALPPDSKTSIDLSKLMLNRENIGKDYFYMTKNKAQNTNISYGLAIKYTTTNNPSEKSIYKTNNYKLIDLL